MTGLTRTELVRVLFLNAKNMLSANEAMWDGSVNGDPTPSSQENIR